MSRAIWQGHISFGLINIPVSLFSGENKSELHFHMVDSRNNARVRYERINEETGEEVPWNAVVKGYEYSDHNLVLLKEEDFKRADIKASQTIDIEDFIDEKSLDSLYFEKPYILVPGKKAEKSYVLLRETLKQTGKAGIAKVVIRTRQYVAALMPRGNALYLNLLRYYQELKQPTEYDLPAGGLEKYRISGREMDMAKKFVASLTVKWNPQKYKDKYRDSLLKWIKQKAKAGGKAIPPPQEVEETTDEGVIDIMELLQKSMKGPEKKARHKKSAAA